MARRRSFPRSRDGTLDREAGPARRLADDVRVSACGVLHDVVDVVVRGSSEIGRVLEPQRSVVRVEPGEEAIPVARNPLIPLVLVCQVEVGRGRFSADDDVAVVDGDRVGGIVGRSAEVGRVGEVVACRVETSDPAFVLGVVVRGVILLVGRRVGREVRAERRSGRGTPLRSRGPRCLFRWSRFRERRRNR